MPLDLCRTPPSTSAVWAIDSAAMQLRRVSERLGDAVVAVRRLAASTDWQTPSARAFFALAQHLADDIGGLAPLTDAVRAEMTLARARATLQDSWGCR